MLKEYLIQYQWGIYFFIGAYLAFFVTYGKVSRLTWRVFLWVLILALDLLYDVLGLILRHLRRLHGEKPPNQKETNVRPHIFENKNYVPVNEKDLKEWLDKNPDLRKANSGNYNPYK